MTTRHLAAWLLIAAFAAQCRAQDKKPVTPETNPPANITQLSGFGERAAWSPDGKKVAFMSKSFGDAFEIDLETKLTRLLTGHFRHAGFLRVQYLPNGDFFLIGARTFKDINTTRSHDQEMWVMDAAAKKPPVALEHKISEGVAISRTRMRIAWTNTHEQYPDKLMRGESAMYVADIVTKDGKPALANEREILRGHAPECTLEAQDFRSDDTEIIYTCYRPPYADVFGVSVAGGRPITYRKEPNEYNEVEGVAPDGSYTLVESSREQGADRQNSKYIDIWKLSLLPTNRVDFTRLTHWGDYEGYKASNPVISPDGRTMAFQSARNNEPAGVGHGIFLMRLP